MKTKDKILQVALRLFNTKGVDLVSSKQISDEMGISYGNLCYHYPKKDDIIMQLYLQHQNALDEQFATIEKTLPNFEVMFMSLRKMLSIFFEYKFLYLGIASIARRFPQIQRNNLEQAKTRTILMRGLIELMITQNLVKVEKKKGHYDNLIKLTHSLC